MKMLLIISSTLLSLNLAARTIESNLVGNLIDSPLKDQVCRLDLSASGTCSAVRISKDFVLTAQHCVRNKSGIAEKIRIDCHGKKLQVEKVYESKEYINLFSQSENGTKDIEGKFYSAYDFALIKVKANDNFVPKFQILNDFSEFQMTFLKSTKPEEKSYIFNEVTHCEMTGFGMDKYDNIGKLNSAALMSTTFYGENPYYLKAVSQEGGEFMQSPFLPVKNKKIDWSYSVARPGDSGGPLFCRKNSGEWILAGNASILEFGDCPEEFQVNNKKGLFKPAKIQCARNRWALPTIDVLEKILEVEID